MAELRVSVPAKFEDGPVYHKWLPIGPDDAIIVKDGDLTIKFHIRSAVADLPGL